jgi:alkanesulfonate monooxygenase SsuD/methylene tetrahydromethanopterin reductase-like flavin-dependent oxidoreductase (luciferase family)
MIDETSHGRLILGMGVSHRPIVEGVYQEKTMESPRTFFRNYVTIVRDILTGKGYAGAPMKPKAAVHGVPIYMAALALGTVELAGELADGVALYLCPKSRLPKVYAALEKGAARAGRTRSQIDITTGLLACVSDDLRAARALLKQKLVFYGQLPFYNKLMQNSGFVAEAAALAKGDAQAVSDVMVDEICLAGPPARCREQLATFRAAGIQLPIIMPLPLPGHTHMQAARTVIETFA